MADEMQELPWCHVYGAYSYHSEVVIRGNVVALTALRDAINSAIDKGSASANAVSSDGEGYLIEIARVSTIRALGSPEYLFELVYEMGKQEARRRAEISRLPQRKTATE